MLRLVGLAALLVASAAQAVEVGSCEGLDSIGLLVGQPRQFSEGKIRLAHVDTDGEPVCCSSHLLVFIPGHGPSSQCFAVSQKKGGEDAPLGFSSIALSRVSGAYDPARGLLLTVPYTLYNDGRPGTPGTFKVRVDLRGDGSVRIEP